MVSAISENGNDYDLEIENLIFSDLTLLKKLPSEVLRHIIIAKLFEALKNRFQELAMIENGLQLELEKVTAEKKVFFSLLQKETS